MSTDPSGVYRAQFHGEMGECVYELEIASKEVRKEAFSINGETLLERDRHGRGRLKAIDVKSKLRFEVPRNQLAVVLKRDSIQHPYLQELFDWGSSVKTYRFGSEMGARELAIDTSSLSNENSSPKVKRSASPGALDHNKLFIVYKQGVDQFGREFNARVARTLNQLDYRVAKVGVGILDRSEFTGAALPPSYLYVKERDLRCNTRQLEMSAGMFRAFNLAVQLNYWSLSKAKIAMLIDDIGEGLDFERSTRLIRLLANFAAKNDIQLIMTTNDRFVMNSIPLEYWGVVDRRRSVVRVVNKHNSPKAFEAFQTVGLNNFDFFARKLYKRK